MQFFQNPLGPPPGAAVDKEKAIALNLWNKIESALKEQCEGDLILFHAEVKRMCLVIEAGLELWDPRVEPAVDPKAIFLRELSIQMRILAHMRCLSPEKVDEAASDAARKKDSNLVDRLSGAELLLQSLQAQITLSEEELLNGIGVQPLAMVLVEKQQLFEELGPHFYRLHDHATKRRADVERTLTQLLTLRSRKPS